MSYFVTAFYIKQSSNAMKDTESHNKFNVFFEKKFEALYGSILNEMVSMRPLYYLHKGSRLLEEVPPDLSNNKVLENLRDDIWSMISDTLQEIPNTAKIGARGVLIRNTKIPDHVEFTQDKVAIENSVIGNYCKIGRSVIKNSYVLGFDNIQHGVIIEDSVINTHVLMNSWVICYAREVNCNAKVLLKVFLDRFCTIGFNVVVEGEGARFHNFPFIEGHKGGDYSYIGQRAVVYSNSTVVSGYRVGRWSTVGANSLVNMDLPPYSLGIGSPLHIKPYGHRLAGKPSAEVEQMAKNYLRRKCFEERTRGYEYRGIPYREFSTTDESYDSARLLLLYRLVSNDIDSQKSPFDPVFGWLTGDHFSDESGMFRYEYDNYSYLKKYLNGNVVLFHKLLIKELVRGVFVNLHDEEINGKLIITGTASLDSYQELEKARRAIEDSRANVDLHTSAYRAAVERDYSDDDLFKSVEPFFIA